MSKCGSCGGMLWEIGEESPMESRFKFFFVRCTSCKVPIGVVEYFNPHADIEALKKKVEALENTVDTIDENVRRLLRQ